MTAVNNLTEDRIPQEIEEPINAFAVGVNHVGYTKHLRLEEEFGIETKSQNLHKNSHYIQQRGVKMLCSTNRYVTSIVHKSFISFSVTCHLRGMGSIEGIVGYAGMAIFSVHQRDL